MRNYVVFDDEIIQNGMDMFDYVLIKTSEILPAFSLLVSMLKIKKKIVFEIKENDLALYYNQVDIEDGEFDKIIDKFNKIVEIVINDKEFMYYLKDAPEEFIEILFLYLNEDFKNKIENKLQKIY